MISESPPPFVPHPCLPTGHLQTLAGLYLPHAAHLDTGTQQQVKLPDGDTIILHDNAPANWSTGDRVVVLLHGLCGSHSSPYMRRLAAKLNHQAVRTMRMDQRGWGAAEKTARKPTHAGRSDDLRHAVQAVRQICPGSPIALVGFSLGGNVVLKYLAEEGASLQSELAQAVVVSPPSDLAACARSLQRGTSRWYERYFIRRLMQYVRVRARSDPAWHSLLRHQHRVGTLWQFDHHFTAPLSGFHSADDYYQQSSTHRRWQEIKLPTHLLVARDDPLVPYQTFDELTPTARGHSLHVHVTAHGGHLGFVSRGMAVQGTGYSDRRWMDRAIVAWLTNMSDLV